MAIGAGISLRGIYIEEWSFPFVLASGITTADIGKAVAFDTGAANRVKLAGNGDTIIGRLEVVENRVQEGILVGTVQLKGGLEFPVKSGETVNRGDVLVGAGAGEVKALAAVATLGLSTSNTYTDAAVNTAVDAAVDALEARLKNRNLVVETRTGFATAILS